MSRGWPNSVFLTHDLKPFFALMDNPAVLKVFHAARQDIEIMVHRAGIVPHERFEISSLAAIAMLVARGVGVSVAPDAATAWWPTLPVARLPLPEASQARSFGIIWPRASARAKAIEVLVDHARRQGGFGADHRQANALGLRPFAQGMHVGDGDVL